MPVALLAAADDGAIQNIERGEQGGRAVALVSCVIISINSRTMIMGG